MKIVCNVWHKVSELRKTSADISGWDYSAKFAKKHKLTNKSMSWCYGDNPSTWVPEPVEVAMNSENELVYKFANSLPCYEKTKEKFNTAAGVFISHNRGEFGGELIAPNQNTIYGNYVEVFEAFGKIYAIDSCNHLSIGHIKIIEFTDSLEPIELYSTYNICDGVEYISFKALFIDESIYILASGEFSSELICEKSKPEDKSYLFEISKNGFNIKAEFDCGFTWVKNMIIHNNKMILGMDKVVTIVDLSTKEITTYTPISIEAEEDIIIQLKSIK
jgi:hypothetical protein